jgi:diguanylate cyclase (GGDEF)-like protein
VAVLGALCTLGALVLAIPELALSPALAGMLAFGLLLEGMSVSVSGVAFYSLSAGVVLLSVFAGGQPGSVQEALAALALSVSLAGLVGLGRFFGSHPDGFQGSLSSRLSGFGLNVLRLALVAGVALGITASGLGVLAAAAAGYSLWLIFDLFVLGPMSDKVEESQGLWDRIPFARKAFLPIPVLLGIAGSAVMPDDTQLSLVLVAAVAAVGLAFRNIARYYTEELLVKDQETLEINIKQLASQKDRLEQQLSVAQAEQTQATTELRSVYTMAESLGASTKVEDTLSVVAYMVKTLRVPYRSCVIFLEQAETLAAVHKDTDEAIDKVLSMSHLLNLEEALINKVMQTGKAQWKPDMGTSAEGRIFKDERSCMCVPLLVNKKPIGVIYVGSLNADTHNQEHFNALKMVAALAAPSIKTATLFEKNVERLRTEKSARQGVEAKNAQLAELQLMGQKMGATLKTDTTIKVVAEALLKMTPAQSVILFTPDKTAGADGHLWQAEFALTPYDAYVRNLALRDDEGLLSRAVSTHRTLLIRNLANSDLRNILGAENSIVIAPLLSGAGDNEADGAHEQELLGILYVGAAAQDALTEDHGNLIETVSYQAAMALKNARLYEQTQQQALTDGLTGLFTHRLFQEKLGDALVSAENTHRPMVLAMVDCDNFKTYNDTLGHPAGDALLIEIASLLKDKVRPDDIVSRYGGDEFALLLKNTGKEEAVRVCERVREAFLLRFGGQEVQVTASIGLACYPIDAVTKKDLAKAADDALYVAKRGGRNRVSASKTLSERSVKPLVEEVLVRNIGR